jgi:hypothetical protein
MGVRAYDPDAVRGLPGLDYARYAEGAAKGPVLRRWNFARSPEAVA